jgi:hypothetical protein
VCDLGAAFLQHRFFVNWQSYDLYFLGIPRGTGATTPEVPKAWTACVEAVDAWLAPEGRRRRSRYRQAMARLLGDRAFVWQRAILSRLSDWVE